MFAYVTWSFQWFLVSTILVHSSSNNKGPIKFANFQIVFSLFPQICLWRFVLKRHIYTSKFQIIWICCKGYGGFLVIFKILGGGRGLHKRSWNFTYFVPSHYFVGTFFIFLHFFWFIGFVEAHSHIKFQVIWRCYMSSWRFFRFWKWKGWVCGILKSFPNFRPFINFFCHNSISNIFYFIRFNLKRCIYTPNPKPWTYYMGFGRFFVLRCG